jgi:hypothetical protein
MPNTINHLDGGVFSQLGKFIKLHQGLAKRNKVKFIDEFLNDYNEKEVRIRKINCLATHFFSLRHYFR